MVIRPDCLNRAMAISWETIFMTCTGCAIKRSIKSVSLQGRNIKVNNTYIGDLGSARG